MATIVYQDLLIVCVYVVLGESGCVSHYKSTPNCAHVGYYTRIHRHLRISSH